MMLETLFALSFLVKASLDLPATEDASRMAWLRVLIPRRETALRKLVQRATDCIVHAVATDPRYGAARRPAELNDLIVDSIAVCRQPVRAMIDAHSRMYGEGSGEAFLLGPYLDVLPAAVINQVNTRQP